MTESRKISYRMNLWLSFARTASQGTSKSRYLWGVYRKEHNAFVGIRAPMSLAIAKCVGVRYNSKPLRHSGV